MSTITKTEESCKWCGKELVNLFEFDLSDSMLDFIPFKGNKLTITTCEACACYGEHLYMDVGLDGESTWSTYSEKPDYLPGNTDEYVGLPMNKLSMSSKPRLWHYSADWCLPSTFSQVGGVPSWIQDFDYGPCPKCNKSMLFIAQLSVEDIEEFGEGIYYGLLCPDCSITTVRYQQT